MILVFLTFFLSLSHSSEWLSASKTNSGISYSNKRFSKNHFQVTAQYDSLRKSTNLDKLDISVNDKTFSKDQPFCIGFVEGYLLAYEIYNSYTNRMDNFNSLFSSASKRNEALKFTNANLEYIQKQIQDNPNDIYWQQVEVVYLQFDGLVTGYAQRMHDDNITNMTLSREELWLLQAVGERHDLIPHIEQLNTLNHTPSNSAYSNIDIPNHWMTAGSAVGLVKLRTHMATELYTSHTAYDSYTALRRLTKRVSYILPSAVRVSDSNKINTNNDELISSSYYSSSHSAQNKPNRVVISYTTTPGCLSSSDEFYVSSHGLVISSARMISFHDAMYNSITSDGVLAWMRSLVALMNSKTASEYISASVKHSSLTGTRTSIVVDYNKFHPSASHMKDKLASECVVVCETYPQKATEGDSGLFIQTDVTNSVISSKYLLIQNTPYSESTYNTLGYIEKVGNNSSNKNATRAFFIGRTDSQRIQDALSTINKETADMLALEEYVRHNRYKSDTHSILPHTHTHDPCASFGAHCELRNSSDGIIPIAYGSVGAAVASSHSIKYNNYATVAGASPVLNQNALSVDQMSTKTPFKHAGMPQNMMALSYNMMAMQGERKEAASIIMAVVLILSLVIAITGAIVAIVYLVFRCRAKKIDAQRGLVNYSS